MHVQDANMHVTDVNMYVTDANMHVTDVNMHVTDVNMHVRVCDLQHLVSPHQPSLLAILFPPIIGNLNIATISHLASL